MSEAKRQDMPVRVLVLGASGMLGSAVLKLLAGSPGFAVTGAARTNVVTMRAREWGAAVVEGLDACDPDALSRLLAQIRPQMVVNCIGLVKQLSGGTTVQTALPLNSLLPHRLVDLCALAGARLIHVSTDCVFSGEKGRYVEADTPDARDVYGLSKLLGEVDAPHAITLRTSIIGHEIGSRRGLVDWFLGEPQEVRGFDRAIFSGLPTLELARVIRDYVLPFPELRGLYHVSTEPISKHDLLQLVNDIYGSEKRIARDSTLVIDRSLDSRRFQEATGYRPPSWPQLIAAMRDDR